jgi:uncharacterized metal-binding protein
MREEPKDRACSAAPEFIFACSRAADVGFSGFGHVRLSDLGMEKGKAPATEERIEAAAACARKLLQD